MHSERQDLTTDISGNTVLILILDVPCNVVIGIVLKMSPLAVKSLPSLSFVLRIDSSGGEVTASRVQQSQQALWGLGDPWVDHSLFPPPITVSIGLVLTCGVDGGVQTSPHSRGGRRSDVRREGEERRREEAS